MVPGRKHILVPVIAVPVRRALHRLRRVRGHLVVGLIRMGHAMCRHVQPITMHRQQPHVRMWGRGIIPLMVQLGVRHVRTSPQIRTIPVLAVVRIHADGRVIQGII